MGFTRKFATFREAVLYMLKKGDLTDKENPPPSYLRAVDETLREDEMEPEAVPPPMQSASTAHRRTVVFPPNPVTRTTSLPAGSISAPPRAFRAAHGGVVPMARSSNCSSRSVSPIKRTPGPSTTQSRSHTSRSASPSKRSTRAHSHVKEEDESQYLPLYRDDTDPEEDPSSSDNAAENEVMPEELADGE